MQCAGLSLGSRGSGCKVENVLCERILSVWFDAGDIGEARQLWCDNSSLWVILLMLWRTLNGPV